MTIVARVFFAAAFLTLTACTDATPTQNTDPLADALQALPAAAVEAEGLAFSLRDVSAATPVVLMVATRGEDSTAADMLLSVAGRGDTTITVGRPHRCGGDEAACTVGEHVAWLTLSQWMHTSRAVRTNAVIGFKEADRETGVVGGTTVVSDTTVQEMKQWLVQRHFVTDREYGYIPAVAGHLPLEFDLVGDVRDHANIEYVEPVLFGSWANVPFEDWYPLYASFTLDDLGLAVIPGDSVVGYYRQPDGSLLEAAVLIVP